VIMSKHYDYVVIGAGQAGTPLAGVLSKAGRKTALIERSHLGGCCINEGCTPTKTLIASGRVAYLAHRSGDYGVHPINAEDGRISIDMKKVRQRKRDIVTSFRGGTEVRTQSAGVDILMGEGSFKNSKTLLVKAADGTETTISADSFIINTGERPVKPLIAGLDSVPEFLVLDSTSIQELDEVPSHILILGGGYIGLEFGQLFSRLGAQVTIVQRAPRLLPREDSEIADCILKILRQDGIAVHLSTTAIKVASSSKNTVSLTIRSDDGEEHTLVGSHMLAAAGRTPNVESLNLTAAGVTSTKPNGAGYIVCNERLETNVSGIYVTGDVKGPPAFTHISYDDFRILQANLLHESVPPLTTTDRIVPYVCYTDPQMGHVGLHEAEARAKFPGTNIKTASMPMAYVARALEMDESRGMMKAVVDMESGLILGFSCLGIEGGEIMSMVQMAMMGGLRWEKLRDAVFAHPALAESLNNLWGFLK
jgi:pyruvate/2-oxoglutarate dehydrogenase complex dihydrolipoamide dehydrogenase (E3) component